MYRLGCVTLAIALLLVVLIPLLFFQAISAALVKLGIPPDMAVIILLAMLAGGFVNIPLRSHECPKFVKRDVLSIVGLAGLLPNLEERSRRCVIALNVGGCLIPAGLALYEIVRIAGGERAAWTLLATAAAAALNVFICYRLARPVSGIGIMLPGLVPAIVAAIAALILARHQAPAVAFVAGVAGPLIGADLLHLKDLREKPVGLASIGGAGTFDGIVLSAVLATLLA
jgi:uncharacterized membrane protein